MELGRASPRCQPQRPGRHVVAGNGWAIGSGHEAYRAGHGFRRQRVRRPRRSLGPWPSRAICVRVGRAPAGARRAGEDRGRRRPGDADARQPAHARHRSPPPSPAARPSSTPPASPFERGKQRYRAGARRWRAGDRRGGPPPPASSALVHISGIGVYDRGHLGTASCAPRSRPIKLDRGRPLQRATILRPSVVFWARTTPSSTSWRAIAALSLPSCRWSATARPSLQPVYVGDLARAVVGGAGEAGDGAGSVFELGGPARLQLPRAGRPSTLREIDRKEADVWPFPSGLMKPSGFFASVPARRCSAPSADHLAIRPIS